jgi:CubicO group peptidase (beta-lactamase class C family)
MWRRTTALGVCLAGAACAVASAAQIEERITPWYPDTAALTRDVPELLRTSSVPGLSIAVVRGGRVVWSGAFGTLNDSAKAPLDSTAVFEAASLSKPVFAYLVLRLADRGELDLDRPLAEILDYPRLGPDARGRRITARMVLSHATGLPNWGGDTLRVRFDPGTDYGYSGEGFLYLQKALERMTGRSLEELATREVFRPLGMTRSSYVWQQRFAGHAAWARSWLWRVAPVNRYTEGNAAYSLVTTAADYARFVSAVLTGRGLSPAMWKAFLTPVRETDPGIHIGLGVRLEDGPAGRRFFHSGSNGRRFTCYMAGDLGSGLGLAFFTSAYDGTTLVRPLAMRVLGDDRPPRNWAWYDRHDDPRRLALKSVQGAALDGGPDAARLRLREVQSNPATRLGYDQLLDLGAFLAGRGRASLSVEILRSVVAGAPDSGTAHLALGEALESADSIESAIESYRRAAVLGSDDQEARGHISWAEERLAARARRAALSRRMLASYAGDYGERKVELREGRLHFGGGAEPESVLVPMGPDLFEVEKDPAVRVQFSAAGARPAAELVAIYRNGTVDRWRRAR